MRQPALAEAAQQARSLAGACMAPAKLRRLLFLCDELRARRPDWRVVVFTLRKETLGLIRHALAGKGVPAGFIQGGQARENQLAIEQFRTSPPGVHVLVSTDAGAEGVNLQAANVLVNYDLPWNPMVVEQRIGRLQRLASEHASVLICNLVAADSVEERVVARLMEKLQGIAQAIGDVESILESTSGEGDEERFEEQIRTLVVKSLLGQDVEQAVRLAQESIDNARRQIEEQRTEIDETLGRLDEMHHDGPRMPRLTRPAPSVAAPDFVLRAMRMEGGMVGEPLPGAVSVSAANWSQPVQDALSPEAADTDKIDLYQPGQAEFERLVQHWVDRGGHRAQDVRWKTEAGVEQLVKAWCETVPESRLLSFQIQERFPRFQGRVRVKVKASNGVDSYEKLMGSEFHPEGHRSVAPAAGPTDLLLAAIRPSEVLPDCMVPLAQAIAADSDVAEFCRFYLERRAEELARAGKDPRLQHKVNENFTPSVAADVVSLQGVCYDEVHCNVCFSVQGVDGYEATLRAAPAAGQLLEEPERRVCEQTGLRVPLGCLEVCQPEGKWVLRHLLEASEETGRWTLRGKLVTCQITGKKVCPDEAARSTVSGVVALKSHLVTCQHTGDWLLPSEAGRSALTGRVVRKDLLLSSAKPPHREGLREEMAECQATGRRLLLDETGLSAASGLRFDRDLMVPSARSGALALPAELVSCEESGALLLPEETARCSVTGKRVDARLLSTSEHSGRIALTPLMRRCVCTGKLALAEELERCELTGNWRLPQRTENLP